MGLSMVPLQANASDMQELLDDAVRRHDGSGRSLDRITGIIARARSAGIELDIGRARAIATGGKPDTVPSTATSDQAFFDQAAAKIARERGDTGKLPSLFDVGKGLHDLPGNLWDAGSAVVEKLGDQWIDEDEFTGTPFLETDFMRGLTGGAENPGLWPDELDPDLLLDMPAVPGNVEMDDSLPLDPWAQGITPAPNTMTFEDADLTGTLSTTDAPDPLDITAPAIEIDAAQEDIDRKSTELIQNDRDLGGDGFSENRPFAKTRGKVLDWLGHDEESGQRLGNSLMTAGGAILASKAGSWQGALGEGIMAGRDDYDDMKQDSIDNANERERLDMAQMEMEDRRADRAERRRKDALDRAEAAVRGQLEGFTYDEDGNMTGWSAKQARKYAGITGKPAKPSSPAGKIMKDIEDEATRIMQKDPTIDPQVAWSIAEERIRRYSTFGKDQGIDLSGISGD